MASLWDYISPTGEGSQARSNWLRENVDQPISDAARYYLGARTGVPNLLGLLADGTPSSGLGRASQASQQLFAPDQSIMDRITSTGNLLSETAGVGAGLLGVNQTARAVGPAVEDATRAFGRNVAERLNQRGPMPTLGSNGGNIPALSKADQMRREANIQRFGYDPSEVPVEPTGILAYHGTPHSFDKFDTSKIGTGEGAQAYGHGLYFAENEGVARGYRDALSGNLKATIGKKPIMDVYSGLEKQAERMPIKSAQDTYDKMDFLYNLENTSDFNVAFSRIENPSVAKWAEKEIKPKFNPAGNMYEVKINADPKDFLNWDLPISQQPKAFQDIVRNSDLTHLPEHGRLRRTIEAWRKNKGDWVPESGANIPEPSGNDIYNALTDFGTDPTRNVNFSNELNNSGVKGIKYLDEGSRGKGYEVKLGIKGKPYETEPQYARSKEEADQISKEYQNRGFETKIEESGTRNYVVFDDKLVSIVRKYGIAGAATMLGVSQADVAEAMDQGNKPQGLLSK
jgi:hypothetical protein